MRRPLRGTRSGEAAPDGYTLFLGGVGSHAVNPNMHPKLSYDAVRDFALIGNVVPVPPLHLSAFPSPTSLSRSPFERAFRRLVAEGRQQNPFSFSPVFRGAPETVVDRRQVGLEQTLAISE